MTPLPLLLERFGLPHAELPAPLAGDVGSRQYFRIPSRRATALLVLYPEPGSPAQQRWSFLRDALAAVGLRVPELLDDAPELGAALVEDLGDQDLASELLRATPRERVRLLDEAEELLLAVRTLPGSAASQNPAFDAGFFLTELSHTRTWAFEGGGERPLGDEAAASWNALAAELARTAADPTVTGDAVPTHRDFHANNLMRCHDSRLALIDFQDLRLGPPDYDPVSLRFERAGEAAPCEGAAYHEAVLLQRAWKVLGTFEKMLLKGRTVYRPHRDATLRVIRRHTSPGGAFAPLLPYLDRLSSAHEL